MSFLTDFLLARIAEDEAVARRAHPGPWMYDHGCIDAGLDPIVMSGFDAAGGLSDALDDEDGEHIARFDPARALAGAAAKRAVLAIHRRLADIRPAERDFGASERDANACHGCGFGGMRDDWWVEDVDQCPTLRALALTYADHPDFREEWRL